MGRTVPSFRNILEMERKEWKPFRNALDKKDRKQFDDMFDIPKLYITACSNSVQLVPFHPIAISILFHHYKELTKCSKQVEDMMMRMRTRKRVKLEEDLQKVVEEEGSLPEQYTLFDFLVK
jgi:hypothetical protein